jgi:hypothetical protein
MFNRISKLPSAIFLNLDWANSAQTPIPCAASCRQENRKEKKKKELLDARKIPWAAANHHRF